MPGTGHIPKVDAWLAAANASSVAAGGPPVRSLTSAEVGMPGHDSQEWDFIGNAGAWLLVNSAVPHVLYDWAARPRYLRIDM